MTIEDFVKTWSTESANTQKFLNVLTDTSLAQAVADDHRTLGRMAWHIITTIAEMMSKTGLKPGAIDPEAPTPAVASAIQTSYSAAASELLNQVKADWTDVSLQIEDDLYGEKWKRGLTLDILVRHELHHRGQMSVLMRQAGLQVPGLYGPSKEEWEQHGMPEPAV